MSAVSSGRTSNRWAALAGGCLALILLACFYRIVVGAVDHGSAQREQARLAAETRAACATLADAQSRDLCRVTHAAQAPEDASAAGPASPSLPQGTLLSAGAN